MTENPPPNYGQQPYPPQPQPGYYPPQAPPKKRNTALIVLIVIGVLIMLFCGGCLAVTGLFANEVDKAIEKVDQEDRQPGHVDNPLTVTEGEAFEVSGMKYQAGWSVERDVLGGVAVKGLRVKNTRDENDEVWIDVKLWRGDEVLAVANCITEQIGVGTVSRVPCTSADDMPKNYDKITVNDTL